MYNPATRLLTILELLQSYDQMSGTELAERLEVDKRSVRRYIVMLQDMGIPIEGMTGVYGGYRLRSGFKLPPLMLNENEATIITLGLLGIQRLGLAIEAETVAAALAKIQRVLPEAIRERVQSLDSALMLDNPQPVTVGGTDWLLDVTEAVTLRRSVEMQYLAETGEETSRVVDPYGVATRAGLWYLVGFCHLCKGMRMFRLERIQALDITERVFDPPANFDSLRFVLNSIARIPARRPVEIILDLSFTDAEARIPPGYAVLQPIEHGVRLGAEFNDLNEVALFLAGLDCRFVIVRPEELRAAVHKLGQEMIDLASNRSTSQMLSKRNTERNTLGTASHDRRAHAEDVGEALMPVNRLGNPTLLRLDRFDRLNNSRQIRVRDHDNAVIIRQNEVARVDHDFADTYRDLSHAEPPVDSNARCDVTREGRETQTDEAGPVAHGAVDDDSSESTVASLTSHQLAEQSACPAVGLAIDHQDIARSGLQQRLMHGDDAAGITFHRKGWPSNRQRWRDCPDRRIENADTLLRVSGAGGVQTAQSRDEICLLHVYLLVVRSSPEPDERGLDRFDGNSRSRCGCSVRLLLERRSMRRGGPQIRNRRATNQNFWFDVELAMMFTGAVNQLQQFLNSGHTD